MDLLEQPRWTLIVERQDDQHIRAHLGSHVSVFTQPVPPRAGLQAFYHPFSMLCLACRAAMTPFPPEIVEAIINNLGGDDKVRVPCLTLSLLALWISSILSPSAAGLHVPAGQPGTVLQSHAAHLVYGPCERDASRGRQREAPDPTLSPPKEPAWRRLAPGGGWTKEHNRTGASLRGPWAH